MMFLIAMAFRKSVEIDVVACFTGSELGCMYSLFIGIQGLSSKKGEAI